MKPKTSTRGSIPVLVVSLCAAMTLALSSPALSQSQQHEGKSAEEVAAELNNPNTTLGVLGFPIDFVRYVASPERFGPRHQLRFQVAAVVPLPW